MKSFLNKRIAGNQLTQEEAYAALSIIGRGDAKTSIKDIGINAVTKNRVPGLLQFIPRYPTIVKVGSY